MSTRVKNVSRIVKTNDRGVVQSDGPGRGTTPLTIKEAPVRKHPSVLLVAAALTVAPIISSPTASADVCASAGGRHFSAGGCTDIAGDVAVGAAIAAQHVPYVPGEVPCYTVEGVPYFTPPGDPC